MNRDAIPVIKGPVPTGGPQLVAGVIAVEKLIRHAYVPMHRHECGEGNQRAGDSSWINRFAADLTGGAVNALPQPVLLSLRDVESGEVLEEGDDDNLLLHLDPEKAEAEHRLYVVNGQHRVQALENADVAKLRDYRVVFSCMIGATESQEKEQFCVVNSNAKSVPTESGLAWWRDLAWCLLVQVVEEGGSVPLVLTIDAGRAPVVIALGGSSLSNRSMRLLRRQADRSLLAVLDLSVCDRGRKGLRGAREVECGNALT